MSAAPPHEDDLVFRTLLRADPGSIVGHQLLRLLHPVCRAGRLAALRIPTHPRLARAQELGVPYSWQLSVLAAADRARALTFNSGQIAGLLRALQSAQQLPLQPQQQQEEEEGGDEQQQEQDNEGRQQPGVAEPAAAKSPGPNLTLVVVEGQLPQQGARLLVRLLDLLPGTHSLKRLTLHNMDETGRWEQGNVLLAPPQLPGAQAGINTNSSSGGSSSGTPSSTSTGASSARGGGTSSASSMRGTGEQRAPVVSGGWRTSCRLLGTQQGHGSMRRDNHTRMSDLRPLLEALPQLQALSLFNTSALDLALCSSLLGSVEELNLWSSGVLDGSEPGGGANPGAGAGGMVSVEQEGGGALLGPPGFPGFGGLGGGGAFGLGRGRGAPGAAGLPGLGGLAGAWGVARGGGPPGGGAWPGLGGLGGAGALVGGGGLAGPAGAPALGGVGGAGGLARGGLLPGAGGLPGLGGLGGAAALAGGGAAPGATGLPPGAAAVLADLLAAPAAPPSVAAPTGAGMLEAIAQMTQLKALGLAMFTPFVAAGDLRYTYKRLKLPASFINLQRIRRLNLSHTYLHSSALDLLPGLACLEEVDLSGTGLSAALLTDTIQRLTGLTSLTLRYTPISSLPVGMVALSRLRKLDWSCGHAYVMPPFVSGNHAALQMDVVWRLTGLECLRFEDDTMTALPAGITLLTRLTELSITAASMVELPAHFSCLVNLRELTIKSRHIAAVMEGVTSLTQLTSVRAWKAGQAAPALSPAVQAFVDARQQQSCVIS